MEQKYFCDLATMTRRQLCISSFQDWTGAARNRSILGLIYHVGIGSVPQNHCWNSLRQHYSYLSITVATAWSDGTTFDCAMTSQRNYSCGTRWPVGNETMRLYKGSVQFTIGKTRATPHRSAPARSDLNGILLCHCHSHVSSPF